MARKGMAKRISRADTATAYTLRHFFGREAGARISAAEAANGLLRRQQRTAETPGIVRGKMAPLVAAGFADVSPGPRGGEGWKLTPAGADFITRTLYDGVPPTPVTPRIPKPLPAPWIAAQAGQRRFAETREAALLIAEDMCRENGGIPTSVRKARPGDAGWHPAGVSEEQDKGSRPR